MRETGTAHQGGHFTKGHGVGRSTARIVIAKKRLLVGDRRKEKNKARNPKVIKHQ